MNKYFRSINVWRRTGPGTVRLYVCFEIVGESKYCVQSADNYRYPRDKKQIDEFNDLFLELLVEEEPDLRGGKYDSLEEALRAFDREFENN